MGAKYISFAFTHRESRSSILSSIFKLSLTPLTVVFEIYESLLDNIWCKFQSTITAVSKSSASKFLYYLKQFHLYLSLNMLPPLALTLIIALISLTKAVAAQTPSFLYAFPDCKLDEVETHGGINEKKNGIFILSPRTALAFVLAQKKDVVCQVRTIGIERIFKRDSRYFWSADAKISLANLEWCRSALKDNYVYYNQPKAEGENRVKAPDLVQT